MIELFMIIKGRNLIVALVVVVGIVLIFFISYYVLPRAFVSWTRAAPATSVSLAESYLIGEKILAVAGGQEKARVNVFLLDKNGRPVPGKSAEIEGLEDVTKINPLSDMNGKITYELGSKVEGQFTVTATYEGQRFGSELVVTFRD